MKDIGCYAQIVVYNPEDVIKSFEGITMGELKEGQIFGFQLVKIEKHGKKPVLKLKLVELFYE